MQLLCLLVVLLIAKAVAFVPTASRVSNNRLSMVLQGAAKDLVGSDIEWPEFDPLQFSKTASEEKMAWYRAAELKHGRVSMLAALGQIFAYYYRLDDPVFQQGDKPFKALEQVLSDRPAAAIQIVLAIAAVEAIGVKKQQGNAPGDLSFDPLNLKPSDPETWEKVQVRELKNGRLAMLAIAGNLYTEWLSGNGALEAWKIGAVNPFGDGLGYF